MQVFLLENIPGIGKKNEKIKVSAGYARNFLFPSKLAIEVNEINKNIIEKAELFIQKTKEIIVKKTSVLFDKINGLKITFKSKSHDDGKLYGSIGIIEIIEELKKNGIVLKKNNIILEKPIKKIGSFDVTVELSNQLRPIILVKVVKEK